MMTGVRGEVRGDLGCFEIGWNGFLKANLQRMLVLREGDAHEKGVLRRLLSRAGLHPVQEVEVDRAPFGRVDTVLYSERQRQASEGQKQASEGQGQALGQGQGQGCCARKGLLTQSLATNCFGVKCAAAGLAYYGTSECLPCGSVCRQIACIAFVFVFPCGPCAAKFRCSSVAVSWAVPALYRVAAAIGRLKRNRNIS